MTGLSDRDLAVLDFENMWDLSQHRDHKDTRIRDVFGWSASRYYLVLNGLLADPAAERAHPQLVRRLRRLRVQRRQARTDRQTAVDRMLRSQRLVRS